MKKLLTLFLILFTLTASAQDRSRNVNQKCVTTVVEHLENHKVKVTTWDKCKKVKTIKTYLKKDQPLLFLYAMIYTLVYFYTFSFFCFNI